MHYLYIPYLFTTTVKYIALFDPKLFSIVQYSLKQKYMIAGLSSYINKYTWDNTAQPFLHGMYVTSSRSICICMNSDTAVLGMCHWVIMKKTTLIPPNTVINVVIKSRKWQWHRKISSSAFHIGLHFPYQYLADVLGSSGLHVNMKHHSMFICPSFPSFKRNLTQVLCTSLVKPACTCGLSVSSFSQAVRGRCVWRAERQDEGAIALWSISVARVQLRDGITSPQQHQVRH